MSIRSQLMHSSQVLPFYCIYVCICSILGMDSALALAFPFPIFSGSVIAMGLYCIVLKKQNDDNSRINAEEKVLL